MTDLMKKIARVELYKVAGLAINKTTDTSFLDEGRSYAAIDEADALEQAENFWTVQMGFETFSGIAKLMNRVGEYKIVLVHDDVEEVSP